jgi:hypothetical protein
LHNSIVIPGKLVAIPPEADQPQAEAGATWSPGISKTLDTGFRRYDGKEQNELFNELLGQDARVSLTNFVTFARFGKVTVLFGQTSRKFPYRIMSNRDTHTIALRPVAWCANCTKKFCLVDRTQFIAIGL